MAEITKPKRIFKDLPYRECKGSTCITKDCECLCHFGQHPEDFNLLEEAVW